MYSHDPLELPEPVRVRVPRVRNGDLIAASSADGDEERARLLGILAIMIAEATNPQLNLYEAKHLNDNPDLTYPEITAMAEEGRQKFLDDLKEAMTFLMYNTLEAFIAILEGIQEQSEEDSKALRIFSSFVEEIR